MSAPRKMPPDERRRKERRDEFLALVAQKQNTSIPVLAAHRNGVNRHAARMRPAIPPPLVATPGVAPPLNLEGYAYDAACLAEWIAFLVRRGLL